MLENFKHTLKQTAIYSIGNVSTKIIGFILLPVYTAYLTTSQYGILAILEISGQILIGIFSFNLSTGMMRWLPGAKNSNEEKSIVFTTVTTTLLLASSVSLFLIPLNNYFSELFFGSTKFSLYFTLLFLTSSFGIYNLVPFTLLRHLEKSIMFTVLTTLKFTVTLLFIIYFVVHLKMGIEGILIGQLIGQVLITFLTAPFIIKNIQPHFDFELLKKMFGYSLPLVTSGIFALALTLSDRFFIKFFYDNSSVGIYSLGHKIASVTNLFILQSFQLSFLPIAYKKLNESDHRRFFSKTLTYYTIVLSFSALLISVFSPELLSLLVKRKEFLSAVYVIPLISLAFVVKGIQYNFSLAFHYSKRTSYTAWIVGISAFVNILSNIFLVRKFGYVGAAYSVLISFAFMMIISYVFGQKVFPIKFEIEKLVKIVVTGIFIFVLSTIKFTNFPTINFLFKILLIAIFPLVLYFSKVFEKNEIDAICKILKEKFYI